MTGWEEALGQLRPEVLAVALVCLRILPVVMLCPLLGGQLAPVPVRLAVALSMGLVVRPLVGPVQLEDGGWVRACCGEAAFGLGLGLVSALPFEAARTGGRWIDLFRGTSAEAALPGAGHRESAGGELLHRLLLAMALSSGVLPVLLRALARTFRLVPPGLASPASPGAIAVWVGVAMGTGLAIAAPVLVLCWVVDGALALVARAAPGIPLPEVAPPGRILGGAVVVWLGLGLVCDRLLAAVAATPEAWAALSSDGG